MGATKALIDGFLKRAEELLEPPNLEEYRGNKKAGETSRDLALGAGVGGTIGAGSAASTVLGRAGRRLPTRLTKRIFAGRSALGGLTGLAVAGLLGRNNQPKRFEYHYYK